MKKKIIILIISILFLIFFLIAFYKKVDVYSFKIDINLDNVLALQMDKYVASEIKDKLSQVEELKELVIFSKENELSAYCKIYPHVLNKTLTAQKLQKKLDEALINIDKNATAVFDETYDAKFQSFIVISTDVAEYKTLKKFSDEVFDKLLGLNITKKILNLGEQKRTAYIYFNNSTLVKYNMNLEDIKNIVEQNNILQNSNTKTNSSNSYNISTNGNIESIEDLGNITIFYKNKNFSTKLKDAFRVVEDIKQPSDYYVFFDNKKAQVFALSKKSMCPNFIFKHKLKKLVKELNKKYPCYISLKLIDTNSLDKIEVYFNNRSSIFNTMNKYENIYKIMNDKKIKNTLFFIGQNCPRISNKEVFFEKEKNKITILSNKLNIGKIKEILDSKGIHYIDNRSEKIDITDNDLDELYRKIAEYKDEHTNTFLPYTDKTMQINYNMENYDLNDFLIEKQEVIDTIKAAYDGLECSSYYDDDVKIPVVLQNEDNLDRLYVYSKNYKTLVYLGMVAKSSIKEGFLRVVRKNEKYIGRIFIN